MDIPSHRVSERELLQPYLPRLLTPWLAQTPESTHSEVDGSIAFVDISGFTKLSERLAKKGKVGAEELAGAIGSCFARLLGAAYGNGGALIKFGGDALLLLFTGSDHAARACRSAIGMRRTLREIGPLELSGSHVTLRMSVGVHSGIFHFFLVGESHRELLITGPAATETVAMEGATDAGEIVVSPATAAALPPSVLGEWKGPGRLLRRDPSGLVLDPFVLDAGSADVDLASCVPTAIRQHLLAGGDQPEHRLVTVAFLHFDETDDIIEHAGPAAAAECLGELITDVQRAINRHGISFLGTDIDRNGGKIILAGGAPVATGHDEERMLLALREVVGKDRPFPVHVGVNRGHVFAGDIGPPYRRTYTVMGDAVNLAARVMAQAQTGQILATDTVLTNCRTEFSTAALEPFMVKGKAHPVQAHVVGPVCRARQEVAGRAPLVGREQELQILGAALESACAGRGRVVEIVGEPGMGKSRLMEEFRSRAGGVVKLTGRCELYESSTPYFPFRALLKFALGIDEDQSNEEASQRLTQVLEERAPRLLPWAPLLGIALDLEVPPTPEVEQLEEQFRRTRLEETVGYLVMRLLTVPTLIIFEDAHWMDEASATLLRRLAEGIENASCLLCVTRRDVDTGFTAPSIPQVELLRPAPLDAASAIALLEAETEDAPLAPHEIATLVQRSSGNPLFLRELLAAARAAGSIEGLPGSVEAVIMARIDRLEPPDRSVLRRLSVLGPFFDQQLASAVLEEELPSRGDAVWQRLADFIAIDESGSFQFRHDLIRDAAYEGLPYRLRRSLHAIVGDTVVRSSDEATEDQAELLSLHFFHAHRYQLAWQYSCRAAERARVIYANVEAAQFFERALEAARRGAVVDQKELAGVYEAFGEVWECIGEYDRSSEAYGKARRLLDDAAVDAARLLLKQARIRKSSGRYAEALRWISRARKTVETVPGHEAEKQRAQIAVSYASVRFEQGSLSEVVKWSKQAIQTAEAAGERDALAHSSYLLDLAYAFMGQYDDATHSSLALSIYEELGDLRGQGVVLNNLGGLAYWQGRWNEAKELYERGRQARERIGDAVNAADGTVNMAEILADQGRLEEAAPLFRKALRVWKAAGKRSNVAYAVSNLGRLAYLSGDFEEATRLLEQARAEFSALGAEGDVLETDARMAECLVLRGHSELAKAIANDALARTNARGGVGPQTALLHRIRGWAFLQLHDVEQAKTAFEASLAAARARRAEYEVALTLRALSSVAPLDGASPDALREESDAIFDRLGVVSIVDAPVTSTEQVA